jgi:simple sugar transport system permease protein
LTALFALFVVTWRTNQIIAGTALSMLGLGVTGTLYRVMFGSAGAALSVPTVAPVAIPGLHRIPVIGGALFTQPLPTYALYLVVPALAWWLARSNAGLALRAAGERPDAALAAGLSVARLRWGAILFSGAMGGIAGATLVLAQVGTFSEGMSAGRGFIALAIVVLGRWRALGVAAAALLFGAASALQFLSQTMGWSMPYQLSLALPFVLTLVALAGVRGRAAAPAALGATDHAEP